MKSIIPRKTILDSSRILIVDDTRTSRLILHTICASAGFRQIDEAADGQECLVKIAARRHGGTEGSGG
jgi:CheY-like chemotaxis protein